MKEIIMIAAVDNHGGIGKNGVLPWYLPSDLQYFKEVTTGEWIVMGMNTFKSLDYKPLPNRMNFVLTSKDMQSEYNDVFFVKSVNDLFNQYQYDYPLFIIGGASLYKQFMPLATKLYITSVEGNFNCDTFFPEINPNEWILTDAYRGHRDSKNTLNHVFKTYERNSLC